MNDATADFFLRLDKKYSQDAKTKSLHFCQFEAPRYLDIEIPTPSGFPPEGTQVVVVAYAICVDQGNGLMVYGPDADGEPVVVAVFTYASWASLRYKEDLKEDHDLDVPGDFVVTIQNARIGWKAD